MVNRIKNIGNGNEIDVVFPVFPEYNKKEITAVIERMNLTTGKGFGDGEHILYVNGQYRGESDLGN